MPDHFYISDLDGTLLNREGWLSIRTLDILSRAIDAGVHFTIATGRSPSSTRSILKDLNLRYPVICQNGVFITDVRSGEHVEIATPPQQVVKEAIVALRKVGCTPVVCNVTDESDCIYFDGVPHRGYEVWRDLREGYERGSTAECEDVLLEVSERTASLYIIETPEKIQVAIAKALPPYLKFLKLHPFETQDLPGYMWLKMTCRTATKGQAIQRLSKHVRFSLSETTAFGDGTNDLSMFEVVSRKIAVANAHETLLALACETIAEHHEDSVVNYLYEDLKARRGLEL